jgi:hypothetical protein
MTLIFILCHLPFNTSFQKIDGCGKIRSTMHLNFLFYEGVIECNPWDVIEDTTKRNTKNFELLAGKPSEGWGEEQ